jgi:uncharacterized protein (TIRG00374 family)
VSADRAPVAPVNPEAEGRDDDEEMPRIQLSRRSALVTLLFIASVLAFLIVVLPELGGVKDTWNRLDEADPWWIGLALGFQILSMASYILIFQGVHVPPGSPITYRESYLITMAGLAATRLFAAGGAGGVALTAWALRRSGMPRREVAERMIAFLVLLYGVYMAAMLLGGLGLFVGVFSGSDPFALTVVPAIFAAVAIAIFLAVAFVPDDLERRLGRMHPKHPRLVQLVQRLAAGPASLSGGIRFAIGKARHPDAAMIGTVTWWAFNILVLWAAFRAFGHSPPAAVLVVGFFVGMLGNLLPLPGGVGGVDAGMVGTFVAFGVPYGLALIAVLTYRLLAFWLPTIPGAIAYFQLRRTVQGWHRQDRGLRTSPADGGTIQSEVSPRTQVGSE